MSLGITPKIKRIAIFASGTGSNAKVLLEKAKYLSNISIITIVTDKKDAGVINIAKKMNTPHQIIEKNHISQKEHEKKILDYCKKLQIEWIFLAGYMRILSPDFIQQYQTNNTSRIINIHPSLLPAYKGLNAFERAYNDQVPKSGITVHFVNEQIDAGEIIVQESFERSNTDLLEDFIRKGQKIEHKLYPKVLEKLNENLIIPKRNI